jgi:hypothetical protein
VDADVKNPASVVRQAQPRVQGPRLNIPLEHDEKSLVIGGSENAREELRWSKLNCESSD